VPYSVYIDVLRNRKEVYEQAKQMHPERWSGPTRDWDAHQSVALNPMKAALETSTKNSFSQPNDRKKEQEQNTVIKDETFLPLT
jgi:hypothetical protein